MTRAINSNTNVLSIDIPRTHTQMRRVQEERKESGKEMRRDRAKKEKKIRKRPKRRKDFQRNQ